MDRLDSLISTAEQSGLTIDFLEWITRGLDDIAFLIVMEAAANIGGRLVSRDLCYDCAPLIPL